MVSNIFVFIWPLSGGDDEIWLMFFQTGWHHQLESLPPWVLLTIWRSHTYHVISRSTSYHIYLTHLGQWMWEPTAAWILRFKFLTCQSEHLEPLLIWALQLGRVELSFLQRKRMSRVCAKKRFNESAFVLGWCFMLEGRFDWTIISIICDKLVAVWAAWPREAWKVEEFASSLLPSPWSFQV